MLSLKDGCGVVVYCQIKNIQESFLRYDSFCVILGSVEEIDVAKWSHGLAIGFILCCFCLLLESLSSVMKRGNRIILE